MSAEDEPRPRKRPALLAFAMMMMAFMAVSGWASGCRELHYYRSPESIAAPLQEGPDAEARMAMEKAHEHALDAARPRRLPLAAANLVLSALLLFAATRALWGRPRARSLAGQAVVANAGFAVIEYAMNRGFRGEWAQAIVTTAPRSMLKVPPELTDQQVIDAMTMFVWTLFRVQLLLTVGAYLLAWMVLRSRRAREYLDTQGAEIEESET